MCGRFVSPSESAVKAAWNIIEANMPPRSGQRWARYNVAPQQGEPDNYIPANPEQTPTHIVPEWYYLPFYAILRGIPNKLLGVIALATSIIVLAFMPWLDTSRVRSANYRLCLSSVPRSLDSAILVLRSLPAAM